MSILKGETKKEGSMDSIPTTIVIFGASGDLTSRKLIPALYNSFKKGRLSERVNVVGFARRPYTDDTFRAALREGVAKFSAESFAATVWDKFASRLHYFQGDLDVTADFPKLETALQGLEGSLSNRLYYLATAPEHYAIVVGELGAAGMAKQGPGAEVWRRIVIEKPFGPRPGICLGTQPVRPLCFRREPGLSHRPLSRQRDGAEHPFLSFRQYYIRTSLEPSLRQQCAGDRSRDGGRGSPRRLLRPAGVIRDMFQNHLLQLLALVAMEAPSSFSADAVRNEKAKVFESIRPVALTDTVRGQYAGYRETDGVAPGSQTPTFAALKLNIDNWRWQGVPFYLRSGKAMARKTSEIIIEFERPPHLMFHLPEGSDFTPNILSLCIQPDEGIHLRFEAKLPDSTQEMRSVDMDFHYASLFTGSLPEAYERLLLEALDGDASLFTRSDGIEASWRMVDPIIQGWEAGNDPPLATYPVGSWGPGEADQLLLRDGHRWRLGCTDEQDAPHAVQS